MGVLSPHGLNQQQKLKFDNEAETIERIFMLYGSCGFSSDAAASSETAA